MALEPSPSKPLPHPPLQLPQKPPLSYIRPYSFLHPTAPKAETRYRGAADHCLMAALGDRLDTGIDDGFVGTKRLAAGECRSGGCGLFSCTDIRHFDDG